MSGNVPVLLFVLRGCTKIKINIHHSPRARNSSRHWQSVGHFPRIGNQKSGSVNCAIWCSSIFMILIDIWILPQDNRAHKSRGCGYFYCNSGLNIRNMYFWTEPINNCRTHSAVLLFIQVVALLLDHGNKQDVFDALFDYNQNVQRRRVFKFTCLPSNRPITHNRPATDNQSLVGVKMFLFSHWYSRLLARRSDREMTSIKFSLLSMNDDKCWRASNTRPHFFEVEECGLALCLECVNFIPFINTVFTVMPGLIQK